MLIVINLNHPQGPFHEAGFTINVKKPDLKLWNFLTVVLNVKYLRQWSVSQQKVPGLNPTWRFSPRIPSTVQRQGFGHVGGRL